jgi:hypothetical protein
MLHFWILNAHVQKIPNTQGKILLRYHHIVIIYLLQQMRQKQTL